MYLYFIRCHSEARCVKIGRARNPQARLDDLQIGNPHDLTLMYTHNLNSAGRSVDVERQVHHIFKYRHVRGEWFAINKVIKDFIAALAAGVPLSEACRLANQQSIGKRKKWRKINKVGQEKIKPLVVQDDRAVEKELDRQHLADIREVHL